jgi:hypothetical protein
MGGGMVHEKEQHGDSNDLHDKAVLVDPASIDIDPVLQRLVLQL